MKLESQSGYKRKNSFSDESTKKAKTEQTVWNSWEICQVPVCPDVVRNILSFLPDYHLLKFGGCSSQCTQIITDRFWEDLGKAQLHHFKWLDSKSSPGEEHKTDYIRTKIFIILIESQIGKNHSDNDTTKRFYAHNYVDMRRGSNIPECWRIPSNINNDLISRFQGTVDRYPKFSEYFKSYLSNDGKEFIDTDIQYSGDKLFALIQKIRCKVMFKPNFHFYHEDEAVKNKIYSDFKMDLEAGLTYSANILSYTCAYDSKWNELFLLAAEKGNYEPLNNRLGQTGELGVEDLYKNEKTQYPPVLATIARQTVAMPHFSKLDDYIKASEDYKQALAGYGRQAPTHYITQAADTFLKTSTLVLDKEEKIKWLEETVKCYVKLVDVSSFKVSLERNHQPLAACLYLAQESKDNKDKEYYFEKWFSLCERGTAQYTINEKKTFYSKNMIGFCSSLAEKSETSEDKKIYQDFLSRLKKN